MLLNLLICLLILSYILSHDDVPNVVVYNNIELVNNRSKIELSQIVKLFLNTVKTDQFSWSYTDQGYFYPQYLNIKNFTINADKSFFEVNQLESNLLNDSQILNGTNSFLIVINFNFEAKTGIVTYVKGNGTIFVFLTSNLISFTKREYKSDLYNGINSSIEMSFNLSCIYSPFGDNYLSQYFSIFKKNSDSFIQNITKSMQKTVDSFYSNIINQTDTIFNLDLNIANKTYEIDLLYVENPKYDSSKGIIYYHCGEVDDPFFLKAPQDNHEKWDNFSTSDGNFQIFFDYHTLSEIASDISETGTIKFSLNSSDLSPNSSFHLDIRSLSDIAPNFLKYFTADTKLNVFGEFTKITLGMDGDTFTGFFNLEVNLLVQDKVIFMYDVEFYYQLVLIYSNQTFNIKIDSPLEMTDITLIELPDKSIVYGNVNAKILELWTEQAINYSYEKEQMNLFKNNLNFSKYFKNSRLIVIPNQGIVFAGDAQIPYQSKVPVNFVENLFLNLKNK